VVEILFFIILFLLPLGVCEFRNSTRLLLAYWFVITLQHAVAFTNSFLFTVFGADSDALAFHNLGVEMAESGDFFFAIGGIFYENMLGVLYWLFGPSNLIGQQFSILASAFSLIVLIKINKLLGLTRNNALTLIVFGALPSMVLLTSVTLRESYQVLFFMLTVYFGIRMHVKGGINIYSIYMTMSALVMGFFHHALIVYSGFLIALLVYWSPQPAARLWRIKKLRLMLLIIIPVILFLMTTLSNIQIQGLYATSVIVNPDAIPESISIFREKSTIARATYDIVFDQSSLVMIIYSSVLMFVNYLFAPFPWQVSSVIDIYAVLESILRMVFIYYSLKQWKNSFGSQRRLLTLMLILYFSMTFMWAICTSNYGTAIRHHLLSWWILVVTGLPLLTAQFNANSS
jgi:hypothetical protein